MVKRFNKSLVLLIVVLLFISIDTSKNNVHADSFSFKDVPTNKPYASAVYKLAERNIIGGYSDGTFKPSASITRGQAATIMAKILKLDTKNVKDPGFTDVSPDLWSYGAIAAAADKGIFNGYGNGSFGPNDSITRAQMASILIKAFDFNYYSYNTNNYDSAFQPFFDIKNVFSHRDSIHTLHKLGIVSGTSPHTYSPNKAITRAQAAVLITKAEKVRSETITLQASDYDWSYFTGYDDYHDLFDGEKNEKEVIVRVIPNRTTKDTLQLVPIKEGTQKLSLTGEYDFPTGEKSEKGLKYYVHVNSDNGKLTVNFEETNDVIPAPTFLKVKQTSIENIKLETMDGTLVNSSLKYEVTKKSEYEKVVSIPVVKTGELIATVTYTDGTSNRYGILSTLSLAQFYPRTGVIKESNNVTVDLSEKQGNFTKYELQKNSGIIEVTRDGNTNVFHITGLKDGYEFIKFPNSDNTKEGEILGLDVYVKTIGKIVNLEIDTFNYDDQFR
ncbi:S-layer homology domain-containing protein [Radiobacillus deserti]|nr:S-layer homology domain-containing protein [Radiobacillus deserti]